MKQHYQSALFLELFVLLSANAYTQFIIQFGINVNQYETALFLLIPMLCSFLFSILITRSQQRAAAKKIEPIFHLIVVVICYIFVVFHLSTDILPSPTLIMFPFVIWLVLIFFLTSTCVLIYVNAQPTEDTPGNQLDPKSGFILIFIFIGTMGIMQFSQNYILFFAVSSCLHLGYLLLASFYHGKTKKEPSAEIIIEKQNQISKPSIPSIPPIPLKILAVIGNFFQFIFLICTLFVTWYLLAFLYHPNLVFGIEGRVESVTTIWGSAALLIGLIFNITGEIYKPKRIAHEFLQMIGLFLLAVIGLYYFPVVGLFLLGALVGIFLLQVPHRNIRLVIIIIWAVVLVNIFGYYLLFEFPYAFGLFGDGVNAELELFAIILTIVFGISVGLKAVNYLLLGAKTKKEATS